MQPLLPLHALLGELNAIVQNAFFSFLGVGEGLKEESHLIFPPMRLAHCWKGLGSELTLFELNLAAVVATREEVEGLLKGKNLTFLLEELLPLFLQSRGGMEHGGEREGVEEC